LPSYFAAPSGTVWVPSMGGTSGGSTGGVNGGAGGTTGGTSGGTPSGASLHPAQPGIPRNVPTPTPIPLAPLSNPRLGITNGSFTVAQPDQPGFGWTERGQVTVAGGTATLHEGGRV